MYLTIGDGSTAISQRNVAGTIVISTISGMRCLKNAVVYGVGNR